jgi:hypothetical protein
MIGFFPDPYPDELLYSVCARFNDRVRYPNNSAASKNLFGSSRATAIVDLPCRINYLLSVLPPNHNYTADFIINHQTLAPLYIPFLPAERANLLLDDMKSDGGALRIRARIGATASKIKDLKWLRFCPSCVRDDREHFGEIYWHRVHQVLGAELCPIHGVFLENSRAPRHYFKNPARFFSANKAIHIASPRLFDSSNLDHIILLKVAADISWLLNWHDYTFDPNSLHARYYNLLLKHGMAYYNGRIKTPALTKSLMNFYSPELLKKFQCAISNKHQRWVFRTTHPETTAVAQHPIRHLLIATFLGCTAEEFFSSSYIHKPFGDGPWPCLNHASEHFGQLIINQCRITDNRVTRKTGRPIGNFNCKCGFVYNRVGPDNSENDHFRLSSIQSYGPVWENALKELWSDTSIILKEVARRLGVCELTVNRHAIRFGLPMNISGARRVGIQTIKRYMNYKRSWQDSLDHYRRHWLSVLKANPKASRKQLGKLAYFTYTWLGKNDAEWLATHGPPPRRNYPTRPRLDWKKIDQELSVVIQALIRDIKNLKGKPVRVSIVEVVRRAGYRSYLERQLDKIPCTAKILAQGLESREEFMIRKIQWAEDCYHYEGICPARYQFIERAGAKNEAGRMPIVRKSINAAMERLKKGFS